MYLNNEGSVYLYFHYLAENKANNNEYRQVQLQPVAACFFVPKNSTATQNLLKTHKRAIALCDSIKWSKPQSAATINYNQFE